MDIMHGHHLRLAAGTWWVSRTQLWGCQMISACKCTREGLRSKSVSFEAAAYLIQKTAAMSLVLYNSIAVGPPVCCVLLCAEA